MQDNIEAGIEIRTHKTFRDRLEAAQMCCSALDMQIPLLIDGIDDSVCNNYSGHPDRLYVIDSAGKVAYKGGRGPFGFIPGQLQQSLTMVLIEEMHAAEATQPTSTESGQASSEDDSDSDEVDDRSPGDDTP